MRRMERLQLNLKVGNKNTFHEWGLIPQQLDRLTYRKPHMRKKILFETQLQFTIPLAPEHARTTVGWREGVLLSCCSLYCVWCCAGVIV